MARKDFGTLNYEYLEKAYNFCNMSDADLAERAGLKENDLIAILSYRLGCVSAWLSMGMGKED